MSKPNPQDPNLQVLRRAIAECERRLANARTDEEIESYTLQLASLKSDLARYKRGLIPNLHRE